MNQYWKMGIAIILTALITGGGVYLWQQNQSLKNNQISLMKEFRRQMMERPVVAEKKLPAKQEEKTVTNEEKIVPPAESNQSPVLYEDKEAGILFTTTKECETSLSVKPAAKGGQEVKHYDVYATGSKTWPKNTPWYSYSVFTAKTYNAIIPDELPGRPDIVLKLNSGDLLTKWSHNDGPTDVHCTINVENL